MTFRAAKARLIGRFDFAFSSICLVPGGLQRLRDQTFFKAPKLGKALWKNIVAK